MQTVIVQIFEQSIDSDRSKERFTELRLIPLHLLDSDRSRFPGLLASSAQCFALQSSGSTRRCSVYEKPVSTVSITAFFMDTERASTYLMDGSISDTDSDDAFNFSETSSKPPLPHRNRVYTQTLTLQRTFQLTG